MSDIHPARTYYAAMIPAGGQFSFSEVIGLDTNSYRAFSLYKNSKHYSDKWVLRRPPSLEYFWSAPSGGDQKCYVRCCSDSFKRAFESIEATGFSFYPVSSVTSS